MGENRLNSTGRTSVSAQVKKLKTELADLKSKVAAERKRTKARYLKIIEATAQPYLKADFEAASASEREEMFDLEIGWLIEQRCALMDALAKMQLTIDKAFNDTNPSAGR